jgi:type III secretion protein R
MGFTRFLTWRTAAYLLALIALCCVNPDSLFSQNETLPPPKTAVPAPAGRTAQSKAPGQPAAGTLPNATGAMPSFNVLNEPFGNIQRPSLITQAVAISALALLPFVIMILTPFMKIVIVLSLLRNALGVQQAPPNQVINGVAFMLSLFVMFPTGMKMYDASMVVVNKYQAPDSLVSPESSAYIVAVARASVEPMRDYLKNNSIAKHQALFFRMAYRNMPETYRATLNPTDLMILIPAFITSQLKDAFEIGVLIYIPFFVIDLVVSNILLAMGMMMLSPVTISMPLKLFLLVMLDGWTLLIEGLVSTFR